MKKFTNLLILLAVSLFAACDEPIDPTTPPLDVNLRNIEGIWELESLNGSPLEGDTYVYLVLDKKQTFELYQNTASMFTVLYTGEFTLEENWRVGSVISGTYDYELGAWSHEYIITELYEESMTWTAKDDIKEVQRFVRINKIPDFVVESVRIQ